MVKYEWIKDKVPEDLVIKQVYGIVFSYDGNIFLQVDDNKYKLTGGKPEAYDKTIEDTLKREYLEEVNVEVTDIYYLGYLKVSENNETYAQVRMIGKIKSIGEKQKDKDNGKIYERFLSSTKNVKKYLNYQDAGNKMLDDAIEMGLEKYNLTPNDKEYYI